MPSDGHDGGSARDPDALPDSTDPSGPCPNCGRVSNFDIAATWPIGFRKDVFVLDRGGQRMPVTDQQVSVLQCNGCAECVVVIEDSYVGGVRHGNSGRQTWRGVHWWPPPSGGSFDPAVPEEIAAAFDEAMRCLSAGAPNGAAALFRNALAFIVVDKGSEAAKSKRDLSEKIRQMIRDGGTLGALGDWAEHVNLYGNAGAHPEVYGNVTPEEAKDVAALTRGMIQLLYEAPAKFAKRRTERGR
jgi:hypothetical protein